MDRDYDKDFKNPLPYAPGGSVRAAWYAKQNELTEAFRKALEAAYKTQELPKALRDTMFGRAWDNGHAYGYNEVAGYYESIAEIALKGFAAGYTKAVNYHGTKKAGG
jgi:hypothetical protein